MTGNRLGLPGNLIAPLWLFFESRQLISGKINPQSSSMNPTPACLLLIIAAFLNSATAEPSISIALVHPDSARILKENDGKLPAELEKTHQLMFELDSAPETEPVTLESFIVSKEPIVTDVDFVGYETMAEAGLLYLRLDARTAVATVLHENPRQTIAMVVDNTWVFQTNCIHDMVPTAGYIAITLFDEYYEACFTLLMQGVRGEAYQQAVEAWIEEDNKRLADVPVLPLHKVTEKEANPTEDSPPQS